MADRQFDPPTLAALLHQRAAEDRPAGGLFRSDRGRWIRQSWTEVAVSAVRIGAWFVGRGVREGELIGLWAPNSDRWIVADLAIASAGCVTVAFDPAWPAEMVVAEAARLNVRHICVGSSAQRTELEDRGWRFGSSGTCLTIEPGVDDALQATGFGASRIGAAEAVPLLKEWATQRRPEQAATLIFTSGTDGSPRAVEISHGAVCSLVESLRKSYLPPGPHRLLCYLPLAHAIGRLLSVYLPLREGASVYVSKGHTHLRAEIKHVRPTVFLGVPRVWEKVWCAFEASPGAPFDAQHALRSGVRRALEMLADQQSQSRRLRHRVTSRLSSLLQALLLRQLGFDQARLLLSGGAPLRDGVQRGLHTLGIKVLEAYGQTESIVTCLSLPDAWRRGSVGRPLRGTTVSIAEDGELLVKNTHLFTRYYGDSDATERSRHGDGWFRTGDQASLDDDGYVRITGRKKALIVTSVGRKVAPEPLESLLMSITGVGHAVVVGEGRKHLTALITPTRPLLPHEGALKCELLARIQARAQVINASIAAYEQIKSIHLLSEPFQSGRGELTQLGKVRREAVTARYAAEIDAMYLDAALRSHVSLDQPGSS